MKKTYYLFLILLLSTFNIFISDKMISDCFYIPQNIEETALFRNNYISKKAIKKAAAMSIENKCQISDILNTVYLLNACKIKDIRMPYSSIKKLQEKYMMMHSKEYQSSLKAIAAVYDDIKYFPVAKGISSDYWVLYDNSYGSDRNYNGKYKHEGIDLMAENNISGYYPIVSVTDGVIENIGWLEKGGYRVGVRSKSSGYFYYAHLSSYANIKKGDKIKAGTLLGYMGDTGYGKIEGTSGNFDVHLHFGIYIKTENYEELSMNPYYVLKYLEDSLIIADY
jgi:hypothetical protein